MLSAVDNIPIKIGGMQPRKKRMMEPEVKKVSLSEKIFQYRKEKKITQEELADKLNVTRQTISKWETEESLPDLDKIAPLCELFGISADELLTDKKTVSNSKREEPDKRRALVISSSVTIYFLSIIWVIFASEVLKVSDGILVSIFLLLCTIATVILVYHFTLHSKKKTEEEKVEKKPSIQENIIGIIAILFTIAYFVLSYITMAWHLTWMLWLVFAIVKMIVEIIFQMVGEKNEK